MYIYMYKFTYAYRCIYIYIYKMHLEPPSVLTCMHVYLCI